MELANNAIPIFREGIDFRRVMPNDIQPASSCYHAYNKLENCVLKNKIHPADHSSTSLFR